MSESENCPKCDSVLPPRYATGRVVCRRCGWTDQPRNTSVPDVAPEQVSHSIVTPVPMSLMSKNQGISVQGARNPTRALGWVLFIVGSGMMGIGLTYDPTVKSGSLGFERTYNIGAISIKNTYTNTGGFIAVCGAVFITRSIIQGEEGKKENQEDNTKGS